VTTPEELSGVWGYSRGGLGARYYQFTQDGTFSNAASLTRERLEDTPAVKGEFWFEGSQLHLNVIEFLATGEPCVGEIGVYEAQLLENGNLRFIVIDDDCSWRIGDLGNDFEPAELSE
jgi:hypothetical protein